MAELHLEEDPRVLWGPHEHERLVHVPTTGFKYDFENYFHPFVGELKGFFDKAVFLPLGIKGRGFCWDFDILHEGGDNVFFPVGVN